MIRVAGFAVVDPGDQFLHFLRQYGVEDVVLVPPSRAEMLERFPPDRADQTGFYWRPADLERLRRRCEAIGLRVAAMENPVPAWCFAQIILGGPGRDQQIENYQHTIRSAGAAGIPVLGYNWMVNPPEMTRYSWRTSFDVPGRAGALVEAFDWEHAKDLPLSRDRDYTEDEIWANYTYFIQAVVPTLEESGVRIALHPDDPPIERIGGIPRLFRDFAGFDRAMTIAASPASGLNFCLGNWTAMGTDIPAAVHHFGSRGQIIYGHVQGVQGAVPSFRECFLDEADCDWPAVIDALRAVGFDGVLAPAHYPHTVGDTDRQHHGHAFAIGFLKGLLARA